MPLSWEEYYAREEAIAEGYCNSVRKKYGLKRASGDEDCQSEPCCEGCKWTKGE
jgi:hypothetical protein